MTHSSFHLQITSEDRPSIPHWLSEVALIAQIFTASDILKRIEEQVRFARARFGTYELVDFVAVLIGYAVSGEPSRKPFTNGSSLLPQPLWPSSVSRACLIVLP